MPSQPSASLMEEARCPIKLLPPESYGRRVASVGLALHCVWSTLGQTAPWRSMEDPRLFLMTSHPSRTFRCAARSVIVRPTGTFAGLHVVALAATYPPPSAEIASGAQTTWCGDCHSIPFSRVFNKRLRVDGRCRGGSSQWRATCPADWWLCLC